MPLFDQLDPAAPAFSSRVLKTVLDLECSVCSASPLTPRRFWATAAAGLALVGAVIGGLALRRSANRIGPDNGRLGAIVAVAAGLIALVNGGLNLAMATGDPGTGNGVVGGAAALVLGLIGTPLGGLALARSRRTV
jgi:hypothetical protein